MPNLKDFVENTFKDQTIFTLSPQEYEEYIKTKIESSNYKLSDLLDLTDSEGVNFLLKKCIKNSNRKLFDKSLEIGAQTNQHTLDFMLHHSLISNDIKFDIITSYLDLILNSQKVSEEEIIATINTLESFVTFIQKNQPQSSWGQFCQRVVEEILTNHDEKKGWRSMIGLKLSKNFGIDDTCFQSHFRRPSYVAIFKNNPRILDDYTSGLSANKINDIDQSKEIETNKDSELRRRVKNKNTELEELTKLGEHEPLLTPKTPPKNPRSTLQTITLSIANVLGWSGELAQAQKNR